jgi:hydrogenase expression/formation protein HypC
MCLTLPAQVLEITDGWATVEIGGVRRRASILAVPEIRVGDWAILSAGSLIQTLDPRTAAEITAAVRAISAPPDAEPNGAPS